MMYFVLHFLMISFLSVEVICKNNNAFASCTNFMRVCSEPRNLCKSQARKAEYAMSKKITNLEKLCKSPACSYKAGKLNMFLLVISTNQDSSSDMYEEYFIGKQILLIGHCVGNISVFLSSNNISDCDNEYFKEPKFIPYNEENMMPRARKLRRFELFRFIMSVIELSYKLMCKDSIHSAKEYAFMLMGKLGSKCQLTSSSLNKHFKPTDILLSKNHYIANMISTTSHSDAVLWVPEGISNLTVSTITLSSEPTNSSIKHILTRHSHHGDIPYLIITLVCTLCGGSCLTFLLCFRRIRHFICTCCNLCREVNRYSRFYDD